MTIVVAREAKKAQKAKKNIIDNHHNSSESPMKWGNGHFPIPRAQQVGDDHILAMYKRIQKDIAKRNREFEQEKKMFDIHEAAKKAIEKL